MSFAVSFFPLARVGFCCVRGGFLVADTGLGLLGTFLFPESLYIICFCLSLSAGENSLFFDSTLELLAEFQSFDL